MQSMLKVTSGALTLSLVALMALACVPVDEQVETGPPEINYWEQRKGNCEAILTSPQAYQIPEVTDCMKIWETYRPVGDLSVDMRSMYAVGFSLAWYKAKDDYDRLVAEAALGRLCVPRHPMGEDGKIKEEVPQVLNCSVGSTAERAPQEGEAKAGTVTAPVDTVADTRGTVRVEAANEKRYKKAQSANKKGLKSASNKAYGKAVDSYEEALQIYPFYVTAKYNLVCALAAMGDDEGALQNLEELYTWDDSEVSAKLIKARSDEDLVALRDNQKFKQLTGYFRLTIANGAGDFGLEHIQRISTELTNRRYAIHSMQNDKKPRMHPYIFYKPGFESYAAEFKTILGAPKIELVKIDWDTLDDMIIMWGQQEASQLYGTDGQAAPLVQGTRAEEKGGGLDDMTKALKDTQGSVEGARDAGEGTTEVVPAE